MNQDEIVVNAAACDERALVGGDHVTELWRKAEREHLGEELGEQVDQAYGTEIRERGGVRFLRQQGDKRLVEPLEATTVDVLDLVARID